LANDIVDRKSNTGYGFKIYGALISWKSQKQLTVILSSTEAELTVLAAVQSSEGLWLRGLLNEIGIPVE